MVDNMVALVLVDHQQVLTHCALCKLFPRDGAAGVDSNVLRQCSRA
jgi:hypothetical protein